MPDPVRPWLPLLALAVVGLACGPGSSDAVCDVPSGVLPEIGSACGPDGQNCTQSEDPCGLVLECKAGTWQERPDDEPACQTTDTPTTFSDDTGTSTTGTPTTGPGGDTMTTTGAVDCEPLPQDGSPCASEGQFCSSPCESPCQFCNSLVCEGGVWRRLEAPPAPCLDCIEVCTFVVPAACAGGPPDEAACVRGCQANMAGDCALLFDQMLACIGPEPAFTCDADARPTVLGCDDPFAALYMCMG